MCKIAFIFVPLHANQHLPGGDYDADFQTPKSLSIF